MNGKNNNYDFLQKILHDVEETKRNLNCEVGTLIAPDGRVLKEYSGESHRIRIPMSEIPLFEGNIFTHNHPGGRTFSQEDVVEFAESRTIEMRVSTPQGTFFSLKERGGEVNRSIGRVMQAEEVGSQLKAAQILEESGSELAGLSRKAKVYDIMGDEIDKWLSENASEFGYIYTKGEI